MEVPDVGVGEHESQPDLVAVVPGPGTALRLVGALQRADVGRRRHPAVTRALVRAEGDAGRQADEVAAAGPVAEDVAVGPVDARPVALDAGQIDRRRCRRRGRWRRGPGIAEEQPRQDRVRLAGCGPIDLDHDRSARRDRDRDVDPAAGHERAGRQRSRPRPAPVVDGHGLAARSERIPVHAVQVEIARVGIREAQAQPDLVVVGPGARPPLDLIGALEGADVGRRRRPAVAGTLLDAEVAPAGSLTRSPLPVQSPRT